MIEKIIAIRAEAETLLRSFPTQDPHSDESVASLWDQGWRFKLANYKQALGKCYHGEKEISFSMNFLESPQETITDTLLHEIAHALCGPKHGHDYTWKAMARKIGADPERLAEEGSYVTTAKYNYKMVCPSCSRTWLRYRMRRRNFGSQCPDCHVEVKIYKIVRK